MELVLQQRQTLNLVMTAELRQAITLLQYTTYELYQFIKEQELENPLIELEEKVEDSPYRSKNTSNSSRVGSADSYQNPIDFVASDEQGMREYLIEQSKWLNLNEQKQELVHYLILNLDENAYLSISEIDISNQLMISAKEVDKGIKSLQQLEPIGVGARNLQECLLLQVQSYYPEEKVAEQIIMNHLDLLANKNWREIARIMSVSLVEIKEAYDIIRTLDPKPCASISDDRTEYLNPDIIIENNEDRFVVHLNDGYIPRIHFNNQYSNLLSDKKDTSKYVQDHYRNYQWLLSSIEQRRTTILRITDVVVKKQQAFFNNGFSALRPLTLKEVADEIGMHESTVSRATMNKVIQTPVGTFDFRRLFTSKLETTDGNSMSQTKVKMLLEGFVQKEDKYKPFSDQKISDYFNSEKGITISRRTVAKYRDELNIPTSRRRRYIKV